MTAGPGEEPTPQRPAAGGGAPAVVAATTSRPRRLLDAVLLLGLVLATFPGLHNSLAPGLDGSWAFGINALPRLDPPISPVAFPFGPLGWLLHPAAIGSHLEWALAMRLLLHAVFALALWRALRTAAIASALGFAACDLTVLALGLPDEYRLLLTLALLLAAGCDADGAPLPSAAATVGALVPVCAALRLHLGASAGLLLATWCGLALRRPPRSWRAAGAAAAGLLAGALLAVPLAFGSLARAARWLALTAEVVRGHVAGMTLPASGPQLAAGWVALAVLAALAGQAWWRRSALVPLWGAVLPSAWLAFQHGYLRADAHRMAFFAFVLGLAAIGLLRSRRRREVATAALACVTLLLLGWSTRPRQPTRESALRTALLGAAGAANLRAALDPRGLHQRIAAVERSALRPVRLPATLVASLRDAGAGVDALPWKLSYLAANHLRWVPGPTLQLYSALTLRLDALAASHFAGAEAPDVLLVERARIDGRDMLWDTPQTWRAILARYELAPTRPTPHVLLLRRRSKPLRWQLRPRGTSTLGRGRWVGLPPPTPGEWTFAAVRLRPSLEGRLRMLALGVPPVYLQADDTAGQTRTVRILPLTAPGGMLVSPAPRGIAELASLWDGSRVPPRLVRLRLVGPGLACFRPLAEVRWLGGRLLAGPSESSGVEPLGDANQRSRGVASPPAP